VGFKQINMSHFILRIVLIDAFFYKIGPGKIGGQGLVSEYFDAILHNRDFISVHKNILSFSR